MMVPGGGRSQGCHGYLPRLSVAPTDFPGNFPHTHLLVTSLKIRSRIISVSTFLCIPLFFSSVFPQLEA